MKGIVGRKLGMTRLFDAERNLLLVKGAVPGPRNGVVEIREDKNRGGA